MKYVEQSRRATDIQNAAMIRDSILADIADGTLSGSITTPVAFKDLADPYVADGSMATAITKAPKVQGNLVTAPSGGTVSFMVLYNAAEGTCSVKVGEYVLTDAEQASNYKLGKTPSGT